MLAALRRFLTEIAGNRATGRRSARTRSGSPRRRSSFTSSPSTGCVDEERARRARRAPPAPLRPRSGRGRASWSRRPRTPTPRRSTSTASPACSSGGSTRADRERIVEMMWQLVYADGSVHEFEDNVVWRVAELLGVSSQVRIRLKQAVRGQCRLTRKRAGPDRAPPGALDARPRRPAADGARLSARHPAAALRRPAAGDARRHMPARSSSAGR